MMTPLPEPGELGVEGHVQMSRLFLEHAGIYLGQGDRIQASEKVWGAAAHALKAIGEQRGWVHSNHSNIYDIGGQLGREFGQERQFLGYLSQAQAMHNNFYENIRDIPAIQSGPVRCRGVRGRTGRCQELAASPLHDTG